MAASVPSTPAAWHLRPGALALSIPPAWQRRLRIALLAVVVLVALFAGLGFLAVPWIAKRQVVSLAASELGRQATVGDIRFNPFTLRGRISDFTLADREPGRTLLAFDSLDLDLAWDSIAKAALMVEQARLAGPRLRISLDAAGKSNVADIVERAMAPRQGGNALPFAVHNIEVEGGTVLFEDARRGHKTEVSRLALGVPFLSSRPSDTTIRVKPHLSGVIDGATFAFEGTTSSPFDDIQRATLSLDLDALALPRYVEYAPLPNGLKLTDGALTTRLALSFLTWKGQARGLELAGTASLDRLAIARPDGSPLVAVKRVEARLHQLDALGRSVSLDRVAVAGPEIDVRRREDGSLELPALFASPAAPVNGVQQDGSAQPWSWSVREASLSDGRVRFVDASVAPPYATTLSGFAIAAAKMASRGEPGTIEASFQAEDGARFSAHANVDVAAQAARGRFEVQRVAIAPLHAYYDKSLAVDVRRGSVSFAGDFEVAPGAPGKLALAGGSLLVEDLDTALRGEREPLVRLSRLEAKDIAVDLAARKVAVGSIAANQGALRLLREAGGRMSFERALPAAEPYRVGAGAKAVAEAQWAAVVNEVVVEGLAADFEDRAVQPPVKVQLAQARLAARNLDTAPGAKSNVDLAARVGSKGRIAVKGTVGLQPLAVQADVQAAGIDLVGFQSYAPPETNVIVTSGTLDVRGRVAYDSGPSGPNVRYVGDLAINGFGSLDQPGSQELMRWKSLAATGIDLATAPFHVAASAVTLDHFYARLILDADAKLNVVQLLKPEPAADAPPAPGAATPAPAGDIPASIARVQLSNGEVEFSDFFIRPNYSVHLTDLDGRLDGLAASQAGTVQVTARVDGAAPVDIRGTVNPFAKPLKLDIDARATGADLSPLTPYAVKYAGYGIEKGKLSMEVHYTVEERKLSATNRITLDQLTFGDHVESPTATKLPVLLLVSLLKDRDGVIKLDLPIAGTLDDPQFSIWRIVLQILGNLLTKAATAPFALLGAMAGGGEQLAYVEFQPGLAVLTPASEQKLATLAKALADRPHVKLDATGRAIAEVDAEALRRASLDRALRHAKQKELARKGESAPPIEEIVLEPAESAKYLKAVYADTQLAGKPRNLIGMQKEIPPEEMEKLLLASYTVGDDALHELANDRAEAVRDWFVSKGNVPVERVFIAAPKLGREGLKDEGAPTRVDFAIR